MTKRKITKGQTMIYKILHKTKDPTKNWGAPEWLAVPAPLVVYV